MLLWELKRLDDISVIEGVGKQKVMTLQGWEMLNTCLFSDFNGGESVQMLMCCRLWRGQQHRFQGLKNFGFFCFQIAFWFRKLTWICTSRSTPLLNWIHIQKKSRTEPIFSTRNRRILKIHFRASVFYYVCFMLFAFPSCLFLRFPTILYCFFPALFLYFIICSKQVVEAMMSENVKLCRSDTIQVFAARCSPRVQPPALLIPSDCSRAASGVCWTLPSLCPRNAALSAPCDSESLWLRARLRAPHSQSSVML